MDSTVIQEIAKQLGMAVDQAGLFIQEQLPSFAALNVVRLSAPLWILGILALVGLFSFILSFAITRDIDHNIVFISLIVCLGSFFVFILWLIFALPDILCWQKYPEAMLIDKAIAAIS